MLRKLIFSTVAFFGLLVLQGTTVRADPIINLTGRAGTGVTASILNYTLVPAGNGLSTFTFTIRNTSSTGYITNIGFNLPGDRPNTYVLNSAKSIDDPSIRYYLKNDSYANATGLNVNMDFALLTYRAADFNAGRVAYGIDPGKSATFSITGNFSGMTAQQVASSIYARFQGIGPSDDSDVAGNPSPMVP